MEIFFVSPLVSAEVAPLGEAPPAYGTRVRFLPCVDTLVHLQVAAAVKAFATERANVPLLPHATVLQSPDLH